MSMVTKIEKMSTKQRRELGEQLIADGREVRKIIDEVLRYERLKEAKDAAKEFSERTKGNEERQEHCSSCKFFTPEVGRTVINTGCCRRSAPEAVTRGEEFERRCIIAIWPQVSVDDWCGEWENRKVG